jgi:hypothetical protein
LGNAVPGTKIRTQLGHHVFHNTSVTYFGRHAQTGTPVIHTTVSHVGSKLPA